MVTPKSKISATQKIKLFWWITKKRKMDKYMVGLYFMSNLCIPSSLGQFEVKPMELRKLQLGIYFEHHCSFIYLRVFGLQLKATWLRL